VKERTVTDDEPVTEEASVFIGVAAVPGALSVPRRRRPLPPPVVALGRAEVVPGQRPEIAENGEKSGRAPTPDTTEPPQPGTPQPVPIRAPSPQTPKSETGNAGGEGENPVRNRGFVRNVGRRAALPAAAAVVAAFVVGTTYVALAGRGTVAEKDSDLGRWAATRSAAVQGAGNAGRPPGDPFGSAAIAATGAPTRVRVAAIGLDSPLETLHIAKGALLPPKRFDRAGWYADGTAPGDIGPAVIAGHVDSKAGPAVFYRLRELTTGDTIEVSRGGRVLKFTVTRTAWYPKNAFPTGVVYGPTPDRQLRLITCGGVFDHKLRSYKDNLVVYAVAG
jgi:hypothetical protein